MKYLIALLLALFLMSSCANAQEELLIHDMGNGFTLVDTGEDVLICTRIGSYTVCN